VSEFGLDHVERVAAARPLQQRCVFACLFMFVYVCSVCTVLQVGGGVRHSSTTGESSLSLAVNTPFYYPHYSGPIQCARGDVGPSAAARSRKCTRDQNGWTCLVAAIPKNIDNHKQICINKLFCVCFVCMYAPMHKRSIWMDKLGCSHKQNKK